MRILKSKYSYNIIVKNNRQIIFNSDIKDFMHFFCFKAKLI